MALIGLRVTQYMYVLFDKVHIYIQKSQFTLVRFVQKCIVSNKHPVKVQRATSNYRNVHFAIILGQHLATETYTAIFQPSRGLTKVRNSINCLVQRQNDRF
jgi:hypothetical protein